jgi:hypothetical protein
MKELDHIPPQFIFKFCPLCGKKLEETDATLSILANA